MAVTDAARLAADDEHVDFRFEQVSVKRGRANVCGWPNVTAVNQLVNVAVAEKLSVLRAEGYFEERRARSNSIRRYAS